EGHRDAHPGTAEPADQCRRIHRANVSRAWHPAPAVANVSPAAVMEWRETPARIVDPRPAPRRNVRPAAEAVWSPVVGDVSRAPDITVFRFADPLAVVVQVLVADDVA